MNLDLLIGIATGVILFMYGIEGFTREIKAVAGDDLRKILGRFTKNPVFGMLLGAVVTALIQSSTATSVLTVSLVNSSIINFQQSIGILLGTNIGTTVTAFLVAYKLTDIGPWFIILGFVLSITRVKYSFIGKALFYFGMVFFALSLLSTMTAPLKGDPVFSAFLATLENPFFGVLAGAIFTALIQSSSVTSGLVVLLVQSGSIDLAGAIPVILGANIGTTFTGILTAISMDTYAQRAAVVNTIFNAGGALVFLLILAPFTQIVESIGGSPAQMTAMAHLIFNVTNSVFFLFLLKPLEKVSEFIVRGKDHEIVFQTLHLNQKVPELFDENLAQIEGEIVHHLHEARSMMATVVSHVDLRTKEGLDRVEKYMNFSQFIARKCEERLHYLALQEVNEEQMSKLVQLLRIVDYIRQSTVSQRQIVDIPELHRLPIVEDLTDLKAEIFAVSSLISRSYEHLAKYIKTSNPTELLDTDEMHEALSKRINDKYRELFFAQDQVHERIRSFLLAFLTRVQSIGAKNREVRKLLAAYISKRNQSEVG